ncbi:MAG: hypothetical protein Q4F58_02700 [Candidatus Saccharibacteria bacterium]|nr:hypothetical protein [Candidatus Saccharibacteria bacterium]
MSTGDTAVLQDLRDGQMYTVAKLADGNVWMVDNLNLGASIGNPRDTVDGICMNWT